MATQGSRQELTGRWLGINLRAERADLGESQLARSVNADLHKFAGTISLRNGRATQFGTPLTDLVVREVFRAAVGSAATQTRYQVAGRQWYRTQVAIQDFTATSLDSGLVTALLAFKPLTDLETWVFAADRAVMQKDNGTVTRRWGLATPAQASGVQPDSTGLDARDDSAGTYSYRFGLTHVRFDAEDARAHESNPLQDTLSE